MVDSKSLRKLGVLPLAGSEEFVDLTDISLYFVSKSVGQCNIRVRPGDYLYFSNFLISRL